MESLDKKSIDPHQSKLGNYIMPMDGIISSQPKKKAGIAAKVKRKIRKKPIQQPVLPTPKKTIFHQAPTYSEDENKKSVKYKIAQIEKQNTKTASETYVVDLEIGIGKGREHSKKGIAKKKVINLLKHGKDVQAAETVSTSANNLGISNEINPRMLARQIASWKVARKLDLRVLSNEKYGLDNDGQIIGISAMVPAPARSLSAEMKDWMSMLEAAKYTPLEMERILGEMVFTPAIQKQLSDLQLLDALVGQTDRHHGNIYIDTKNDKIYGIDNDQAFVSDANRDFLQRQNTVMSWLIPTKDTEISLKYNSPNDKAIDMNRELEFQQNQIDYDTAHKVLNMSEEDLKELLQDKVGSKYGEFLTNEEIESAVGRLTAIKWHILKLRKEGKLIKVWDEKTYMESLTTYGGLKTYREDQPMAAEYNRNHTRYQNYIAREIYSNVHRIGPDGTFEYYEHGKTVDQVRQTLGGDLHTYIKDYGNNIKVKKYFSRNDARMGRRGDGRALEED